MKKFFKSVLVALAIVSSGAVVTSCDEDSPWLSIATGVLEEVLGITTVDDTYTYEGTINVDMYNYNSSNNTYNTDTKQTAAPTVQIDVQTEDGQNGENGYVQFIFKTPITVANTTLSDIVFTTYYKEGTIDPDGGTYLTGGTCNFNGTATEISAACFEGALNSNQLNLKNIYLQVGDKVFMAKFSGNKKETAEQ